MTAEDGTSITITPEPVRVRASVPAPTVWLTYSWAPIWFGDALDEARSTPPEGQVAHTRGREILFATCFVESYLLEWVRDSVLRRDYRELVQYFPPGRKWDFFHKWADIPKQLRRDGLIPAVPLVGDRHGEDWNRLKDYRDGLVHARSSRPQTSAQPKGEEPHPAVDELLELPAGWALGVVIERVRSLHRAAGTDPPSWLTDP
jgi:hypothetical protein